MTRPNLIIDTACPNEARTIASLAREQLQEEAVRLIELRLYPGDDGDDIRSRITCEEVGYTWHNGDEENTPRNLLCVWTFDGDDTLSSLTKAEMVYDAAIGRVSRTTDYAIEARYSDVVITTISK